MSRAGQTAVKHELDAIDLFESTYPSCKFISTDKDDSGLVDGFISVGDVIKGAVEVKCRQTTLDELYGRFNNEWLVSYDKISNARELCVALRIRLSGWLYLPLEKILIVQKICDERGNFLTKVRVESTTTQATINGGQKFGPNAFINIENATTIK
jgi:hypothetical protein